VICYHTTDAAEAILSDGFRDATGSYMFIGAELTGVWLSDTPLDGNEGAKGDQVLRVEFPDEFDLDVFEVVEEGGGMGYREWLLRRGDQHPRHRRADKRRRGGRGQGPAMAVSY
jgi:hypothetical protein